MVVKAPHVLIVGCGDLGERVGKRLIQSGWRVSAMRRSADKLPPGFEPIWGDYTRSADLESVVPLAPHFVLFTPLPASRDAAGYRRGFAEPVATMEASGLLPGARGGVLLSSTRVYAETHGGWVDEDSPLTGEDPAAQAIITAERSFLRGCGNGTVVRASGIYGEWPGMLIRRLMEGLSSPDPGRISNRIHREDLASVVAFALQRQLTGDEENRVYLASDHKPTPLGEIEAWLAAQLALPAPSGTASARRGNRRCSSDRLRAAGFAFTYPDYKAGFSALIEANRNR